MSRDSKRNYSRVVLLDPLPIAENRFIERYVVRSHVRDFLDNAVTSGFRVISVTHNVERKG